MFIQWTQTRSIVTVKMCPESSTEIKAAKLHSQATSVSRQDLIVSAHPKTTKKSKMETGRDKDEPPLFNRELSWLDFNARVLAQATLPSTPLLERVKFLSIFSSNLD